MGLSNDPATQDALSNFDKVCFLELYFYKNQSASFSPLKKRRDAIKTPRPNVS
jgi:hypothetical protein